MLMRFNVSNFMSFDKEAEFSMYSGRVQKFKERVIDVKDIKLLKFCALYGANASGKSNLIKAIDIGAQIITKGINRTDTTELYCKVKEGRKEENSKFEYEIVVNGRTFAYGFSANLYQQKIVSEWLYELCRTGEKVIYERVVESEEFYHEINFKEDENKVKFDVYIEDVKMMDNTLLLYEINRKRLKNEDFEVFTNIYEWFNEKLSIIYPDTVVGESLRLFKNNNNEIVKLLEYFDTGITTYDMQKISEEVFKEYIPEEYEQISKIIKHIPENKKLVEKIGILRIRKNLFEIRVILDKELTIFKLSFKHGKNNKIPFEYGEESDGTRRLIELLDVITAENEDKVYIIDELDRSLHPQMTKKFVDTFFKATRNNNSQLLISTHESTLLDLEFLRRDEIWFVERDTEYTSNIYSLEKFKDRYDKKIAKDYLEGRYGAVPAFKDFETFLGDEA